MIFDELTAQFYGAFDNRAGKPNVSVLRTLFIPKGLIVKCGAGAPEIYDLESFISPREGLLTDGTLTDFYEQEVSARTEIAGSIATRWSLYRKSGILAHIAFEATGIKTMQLVRTETGWKFSSVAWEDERDGFDVEAAWPPR
ncbi:MAG: DUF4440 domain-containing protein [Candidatus Eremiobacteraeota bacterium]|nr:DUF4440 domain-containing protein [Candidatus Eremiobacteraeota bacterium]